jgi:hypothetical protein
MNLLVESPSVKRTFLGLLEKKIEENRKFLDGYSQRCWKTTLQEQNYFWPRFFRLFRKVNETIPNYYHEHCYWHPRWNYLLKYEELKRNIDVSVRVCSDILLSTEDLDAIYGEIEL